MSIQEEKDGFRSSARFTEVKKGSVPPQNESISADEDALDLPELRMEGPSVDEIVTQKREREKKIKEYIPTIQPFMRDSISEIRSFSGLPREEQNDPAVIERVTLLKKKISQALNSATSEIKEVARVAYVLRLIECSEKKREATLDLMKDLVKQGIAEASSSGTINFWERKYALRGIVTQKHVKSVSRSLEDLVFETKRLYREECDKKEKILLAQSEITPMDIIAGKTGKSAFRVPGARSVLLTHFNGEKLFLLDFSNSNSELRLEEIKENGIFLPLYALEQFSWFPNDGNTLVAKFHEIFHRGIKGLIPEKEKKSSQESPVSVEV